MYRNLSFLSILSLVFNLIDFSLVKFILIIKQIVFTWVSGKHSVIESDAAKSCLKSVKADAFSSDGVFGTGKILIIPAPKTAGETWFYCGVPGHCEGGMYGTLVVSAAAPAAPAAGSPGDPNAPAGGAST